MTNTNNMKIDYCVIGDTLRNLRMNKCKTQLELADELGVCYEHYARIEQGKRGMSLKLLFMLMEYFDTDANTILGIKKEAA